MFRTIAIAATLAGLAAAQDTSFDINTIPTATITDNQVTGSVPSTREVVTATGLACVPEGELVFSIQTDTSIQTGTITVTPICGSPPTGILTGSMTTQAIVAPGPVIPGNMTTQAIVAPGPVIPGNMTAVNGTMTSTTGTAGGLTTLTGSQTVVVTTNSAGQTVSTGPTTSQSGSPAGKVVVGGLAGLLGLAAGAAML